MRSDCWPLQPFLRPRQRSRRGWSQSPAALSGTHGAAECPGAKQAPSIAIFFIATSALLEGAYEWFLYFQKLSQSSSATGWGEACSGALSARPGWGMLTAIPPWAWRAPGVREPQQPLPPAASSSGVPAWFRCNPSSVKREFENRHGTSHDIARLTIEAAGCGCHLFDQGRVLLGDLVHLRDGLADLLDARALFVARRADLADEVGDAVDGCTTSVMVTPAWSTRAVPCSTRSTLVLMRVLISLAASAMRCAKRRTSLATTAKPRPCSPARAASTAAFRARMLVWKAMPSMTLMMSAIFWRHR